MKLTSNAPHFDWARLEAGHQSLHEIAVAGIGRHAPGGGMRLADVSHALQHSHLVANRGRTDRRLAAPRDRARADRLRGHHVLFDDVLQDLLAPSTEVHYQALRPPLPL